jgi:hypothetical protein
LSDFYLGTVFLDILRRVGRVDDALGSIPPYRIQTEESGRVSYLDGSWARVGSCFIDKTVLENGNGLHDHTANFVQYLLIRSQDWVDSGIRDG